MAEKISKKDIDLAKPILIRLETETLAWIDQEAYRQRRSRAFVVGQAVRIHRAIVEQLEKERAALE